jgi:hypothetical protein
MKKKQRIILAAAIMSMSLIVFMSMNNGRAAADTFAMKGSPVDVTAQLEQWQWSSGSTAVAIKQQKYRSRSTAAEVPQQKYHSRSTAAEVPQQKYRSRSTAAEVDPQRESEQ